MSHTTSPRGFDLVSATIAACLVLLNPAHAAEGGKPESDPALQAPSINTRPGSEYADGTRAFQGIPGIERAANGQSSARDEVDSGALVSAAVPRMGMRSTRP